MGFPRVQITIAHLMALTLVVALALAPIPFTLRSPTKESIVATGAFEIIFLPVLTSLIVLGTMKPGRGRIRVITGLSLMPVIVFAVSILSLYAFALFRMSTTPGAIQKLWPMLFWAILMILAHFVRHRSWRCPKCGSRILRPLSRQMPEARMWVFSGEYKCGQCGGCCKAPVLVVLAVADGQLRVRTGSTVVRLRPALVNGRKPCQTRPNCRRVDLSPELADSVWKVEDLL